MTMSMNSNPMFRYLEKYVGTYRVKAYFDEEKNDFPRDENGCIDETFDDLYIDCARGEIRHSYKPYKLIWYTDKIGQGRNVLRELEHDYKIIDKVDLKNGSIQINFKGDFSIIYEECDDVLIWFDDKDIKKIANIVSPRTNGKSIKPFSTVNLPKGDYTIPEEDLKKLTSIYKDLDKTEKMQFMRQVIKDYDAVIAKKKSKKILDARKESGLKPKEYIHYIGLWKDFLKFTKEKYDNI